MNSIKRFFKISAIIFFSVVVLVVVGSKFSNPVATQTVTKQDQQAASKPIEAKKKFNEIDLQVKAQRAVKNRLKDPDSAKFGEFYVSSVGAGCGEVNAKNSFGGYTGFKRFVSDGVTVITEDTDDSFKEAWKKFCTK